MNRQKKFLATIFIALCLLVTCFTSANAKGVDSAVENATENGVENELNDETDLQESIYKADLDKYLTGEGITLIGDSIANGNRQIILNQLPGLYIDAKGSRDVCGGFEAAQKLQQEGKLSDIVIVELGTNGSLVNPGYYSTGTQNLLQLLGTEKQIFWITVYCSYSQYMAANNQYIWELDGKYENFHVIDWFTLAVSHPEWFPDGVHPNVEGAKNFAKLLRDSLNEALPNILLNQQ